MPCLVATAAVELALKLLLEGRCCVVAGLAAFALLLLGVLLPPAGVRVALAFIFAALHEMILSPALSGMDDAFDRSLAIKLDTLQVPVCLMRPHGARRVESEAG